LVSIRKAVEDRNSRMPFFTTIGHDLLQIVTVGLGSPLGREVAPREIGAMLAGRLSVRARLAPEFRRVMVACGAGAGLAAVYSAPLGGTLFVLEVLLGTLSLPALIPTFATLRHQDDWTQGDVDLLQVETHFFSIHRSGHRSRLPRCARTYYRGDAEDLSRLPVVTKDCGNGVLDLAFGTVPTNSNRVCGVPQPSAFQKLAVTSVVIHFCLELPRTRQGL
jgi:hypothetical protein